MNNFNITIEMAKRIVNEYADKASVDLVHKQVVEFEEAFVFEFQEWTPYGVREEPFSWFLSKVDGRLYSLNPNVGDIVKMAIDVGRLAEDYDFYGYLKENGFYS